MSQKNIAVGLDVGTTKVSVLIGKINNEQQINYIGIGECLSMGLKKGSIIDIGNAVQAIGQAIHIAEQMAGVKVESVFVNTIVDPLADFKNEKIVNLIKCINRLGINIDKLVYSPVADVEAVLNDQLSKKGIVVIDIGSGTTDIALYYDDKMVKADVLPLGGNHITSDLAFGLRVPLPQAESIKIKYGCVLPEVAAEYDFIQVGDVGQERKVSRKLLSDIIQPRVEEILNMAKEVIGNTECREGSPVLVLTGGTSQLPGIHELASRIFGWPVELNYGNILMEVPQTIKSPAFVTGIGLVKYGMRGLKPTIRINERQKQDAGSGILKKVKNWISEYI